MSVLYPLSEIDAYSVDTFYTVSQKNPFDYDFDDNLNNYKRPIVIIFGTVIT